jgi:hypothetical protein
MVIEKELYGVIRKKLIEKFMGKFDEFYLAITSEGKFPEKILSQVPQHEDIIFSFLKKKNSPDLTGFGKLVKNQWATFQFITVEIKNSIITLEDVARALYIKQKDMQTFSRQSMAS